MNLWESLNALADRPECPHHLNGSCAVCGLPPHNTQLPDGLVWEMTEKLPRNIE